MEATVENMTFVPVASVEPLRIATIQPVHSRGQVGVGCPQDDVVVIRHQAVRETAPPPRLAQLSDEGQEEPAISVVAKDVRTANSSGRHVEDPTGDLLAWATRHDLESTVGAEVTKVAGRNFVDLVRLS